MKKMKMLRLMLVIATVIAIGSGCGNVVPPGTTVMLLKPSGDDTIIKKGVYKKWGRDKVYFVDTKLKSYAKNLKILCADDINMDVSVKWVGSFNVTKESMAIIKAKVPASEVSRKDIVGYELSLDKFYQIAIDDIVSSITRTIVSPYSTDNIREHRETIRNEIKKQVLQRLTSLNYPVLTADILITNLDYPAEVTEMRKRIKNAELKDLENAAIAKAEVSSARRNAEIALENGKAQLVTAQADAAANKVRSESLTPEILKVKELEMFAELAKGPNNTAIVIPFSALGSGMADTLLLKNSIEKLDK